MKQIVWFEEIISQKKEWEPVAQKFQQHFQQNLKYTLTLFV